MQLQLWGCGVEGEVHGFLRAFRSRKSNWGIEHCGAQTVHGKPVVCLVAEWIHFTLFGIILPTVKLKVYTFWGF